LAQPAISAGEVSYKTLRKRPHTLLRYSPFVELMCPLFTRQAFSLAAATFPASRSVFGLDWVWPRFFEPHEISIIHGVGVVHTGQLVRGEHYQALAKLGIHPGEDFQRVMAHHGGFNRRLHRRLIRGKVRLPAIRDPQAPPTLGMRLLRALKLRRAA